MQIEDFNAMEKFKKNYNHLIAFNLALLILFSSNAALSVEESRNFIKRSSDGYTKYFSDQNKKANQFKATITEVEKSEAQPTRPSENQKYLSMNIQNWQSCQKSVIYKEGARLTNPVITNSEAIVEITPPTYTRSLIIRTTLLNSDSTESLKKDQVYVKMNDDCSKSFSIYLTHGSGKYSIDFFISKEPQTFDPTTNEALSNEHSFFRSLKVSNSDQSDKRYLTPTPNMQSNSEQIQSLAAQLTQSLHSDSDKLMAIYNWVTNHIEYDVNAYFTKSYLSSSYKVDALTVLHSKLTICEGYSNLLISLLRAVGIRARAISGIAILNQDPQNPITARHSWVQAQINGKWDSFDPTFDSGGIDNNTKKFIKSPGLKYFGYESLAFQQTHQNSYLRDEN